MTRQFHNLYNHIIFPSAWSSARRVRYALMLLLAAVSCGWTEESAYPVRWTEMVSLESLESIEQKLDEPLKLSGNPKDELQLTGQRSDGDYETVVVKTGRDYLAKIRRGYEPRFSYDKAMASWADKEVLSLALFNMAEPARMSYVSDLSLEDIQLSDIPYNMWIFSSSSQKNETFQDNCPVSIFTERKPHILEWRCLNEPEDDLGAWDYHLEIWGWGDFDRDGVEDVLCLFASYFAYGSNRDLSTVILTRYTENSRLTLLGRGDYFVRKKP